MRSRGQTGNLGVVRRESRKNGRLPFFVVRRDENEHGQQAQGQEKSADFLERDGRRTLAGQGCRVAPVSLAETAQLRPGTLHEGWAVLAAWQRLVAASCRGFG